MPDQPSSTRAVYDATAAQYARVVGTEISDAFEAPLDRELLESLVDEVGAADGPVADLGTGVGRVAGLLARHGLDVVGLDLAPGMLAHARGAHPSVALGAAMLDALPLRDRCLAGAAA